MSAGTYASLARRYASALVESVAQGGGDVEKLLSVSQALSAAYRDSSDFRIALTAPTIRLEVRIRAVEALLVSLGADDRTRRTVRRMIENGRGAAIAELGSEVQAAADRIAGRTQVVVETAREWVPAERSSFESSLGVKNARFVWRVIPSLLGGIRLRFGDRVYDGTIRRQLDRLEQSLLRS